MENIKEEIYMEQKCFENFSGETNVVVTFWSRIQKAYSGYIEKSEHFVTIKMRQLNRETNKRELIVTEEANFGEHYESAKSYFEFLIRK